jgi:serpin B
MATAQQYFDAESATLDFADVEKTLSLMNNWCDKKTHGMIPKMLNDLNPNDVIILANALYFKGNWEEPFDAYYTRKADFFNSDGTTTKVKMMYQEEIDCDYVRTDSFVMAELPYSGSTCMDVILPNNGISVSQCVGQLSQARLDATFEKLSQKKLNVHLPKFDLDFNQNLVDIMKQLGVIDVFSPTDADLNNMSQSSIGGVFVDNAFQLSRISVDERGTVAAAVTVCQMVGCPPPEKVKPIEFNVNRPFAYIIRDYQDGTILFVGKVEKL